MAVGISVEPQTLFGKYEINYKCSFSRNSTTPPPSPSKEKRKKKKPATNQNQNPNEKQTGRIFMENLASSPIQLLQVKDAFHPFLMIFTAICVFCSFLAREHSANGG